jgi:hypothetical protein
MAGFLELQRYANKTSRFPHFLSAPTFNLGVIFFLPRIANNLTVVYQSQTLQRALLSKTEIVLIIMLSLFLRPSLLASVNSTQRKGSFPSFLTMLAWMGLSSAFLKPN